MPGIEPNAGLELTTLRSRVGHLTDGAPQPPEPPDVVITSYTHAANKLNRLKFLAIGFLDTEDVSGRLIQMPEHSTTVKNFSNVRWQL